ncbi:hypothetical protein D3C74_482830 [compost metagenome]
MNIEYFTAEEQAGHQLGFHCPGVNFLQVDATAGDEGFLQGAGAIDLDRHPL